MRAQRFIETVAEDGLLHLSVGRSSGARVEVIVLDCEEEGGQSVAAHPALPQDTMAFADELLANPAEDVWNEL